MEKLMIIVGSLSTLFGGIIVIWNFVDRVKKPVDKAVINKINDVLQPIKSEMADMKNGFEDLKGDIKKLDRNQCMNYLVNYIEDCKNGIPKDDIQDKRASEVFDHYTQDLKGNSYIHDGWEKYVKSRR